MQTLPAETNVVIVGAGPTGLTLACLLAAEGVPFVLLEFALPRASPSG
jgi:2-polyprenyl-6-methoxyphenol hydroxylase-like FAD-dependent oxidoreductase